MAAEAKRVKARVSVIKRKDFRRKTIRDMTPAEQERLGKKMEKEFEAYQKRSATVTPVRTSESIPSSRSRPASQLQNKQQMNGDLKK